MLIITYNLTRAQTIHIDSGNIKREFLVKYESDSIRRYLRFDKDSADTVYGYLNYQVYGKEKLTPPPLKLKDEIKYLDTLLQIAIKHIHMNMLIQLSGFAPFLFQDVKERQIFAFEHSAQWKALNNRPEQKTYEKIAEIMLNSHVYHDLEDFFHKKGYKIKQIGLEKVDYQTGIPMPLMTTFELIATDGKGTTP